jgi:hypothetical protein
MDTTDLWPSSIMFMAIDKPNSPTSTVIFVYALAFTENILLYAAIGAVTWSLAYLVLRLYRSHQDIPK